MRTTRVHAIDAYWSSRGILAEGVVVVVADVSSTTEAVVIGAGRGIWPNGVV